MHTHIAAKDIQLLERGIKKLLNGAFLTSNSLYILGSGVSARHSKMEPALVKFIVDQYYEGGFFDLKDKTSDSFASKLLWPHMVSHKNVFLRELSRKIPDGFIKTIINEEYAQLIPPIDNIEYKIFLLAKKGATIIDMNYEGFAIQNLNNHHHIISLHGIANSNLAKYTKKIRDEILIWNLDMSKHSNIKPYPGEKQTLDTITTYRTYLSDSVFPKLNWLVIIGYSFAHTATGLNDLALYELIKEFVEYYKKIQILIVNPNPEPIAELFEKELNRTIILPAYWDSLTKAIQMNKIILHKDNLRAILSEYYRLLEKQHPST